MIKNNVTRYLDSHNIQYFCFELPAKKLGALETAKILGVKPEIVFKTIVLTREKPKKSPLVMIPGNCQVDLKAVAAFLDDKKVQLATQKMAEELTHLQVGGISPLALINKGFQVLLDQSAFSHEAIHISGGQIGLNIRLHVSDLIRITNAKCANISTPIPDELIE